MTIRSVLILYFFAAFLQAGAYGLTFLLPPLFANFGADEKDVGTVLMSTTVATLVSVLYLGHITAKLGRMYTISCACILISVSLLLFAQASEYGLSVFIAGILLGVGWGLFYVLTPVVLTEITPHNQRIKIFTLLSVFIMAGFGLSPVMGASLVKAGYGIDMTFVVTSVFCFISGGIFCLLARPIAKHALTTETSDSSELSWDSVRTVLRTKAIRPILMVGLGASVFAAVTNFQTVYAEASGLDYSTYFLVYTITVIVCRVLFAKFVGGRAPYGVIALLLAVMVGSVIVLIVVGQNRILYMLAAILFGIGYGVSYPIVKAMAANDADPRLLGQTLQLFGLSYFIGVFGFPFIAGWIITTNGILVLLIVAIVLSVAEFTLSLFRHLFDARERDQNTYSK